MMTADNATSGPPTPAETVLVVEDDPLLRRLISKALRARGYTVLEASRGDEALQLCADHDGPVEALRVLKTVQRSVSKARTQAVLPTKATLLADGSVQIRHERSGSAYAARALGRALAKDLLALGGRELIERLRREAMPGV